MKVDSILNGFVIDHIPAGLGMRLYDLLGLEKLNVTVALIKNVYSKKTGKKDIIKIDADIELNLDVIGYIAKDATVNVIKNGVIIEKKTLSLPEKMVNVIKCKNPRCITTTEQELDHVFTLADSEHGIYRCLYCEAEA
ncbi:MAG: aspartate carbamoyltransferase regulatory subunit [Clostridia bacterium]|nr:aspartate carbamoyltransferase regulatory subunit [Clostridia bacterium]